MPVFGTERRRPGSRSPARSGDGLRREAGSSRRAPGAGRQEGPVGLADRMRGQARPVPGPPRRPGRDRPGRRGERLGRRVLRRRTGARLLRRWRDLAQRPLRRPEPGGAGHEGLQRADAAACAGRFREPRTEPNGGPWTSSADSMGRRCVSWDRLVTDRSEARVIKGSPWGCGGVGVGEVVRRQALVSRLPAAPRSRVGVPSGAKGRRNVNETGVGPWSCRCSSRLQASDQVGMVSSETHHAA